MGVVGFLGYSYLHSAFTTGYEINDKEFKLFIIKLNDSTEVKITIEKYFKTIHFNASGNTMNEYIVTDPYNGKIGMGIKDNFLFGVYNLDDEQLIASYLDQLRNSIPVKNHL